MPVCATALLALLFTVATAAAQSQAPANWDAELRPIEAADRDPEPGVVEIDLVARVAEVEIAGKKVKAWTYNGGLPGPLIRTRLGDRVVVHFINQLPQPTTVHWHGVRVPIEMDGVPGISQPEVKPGESFTYDFVVRDAGLYWYHPHVMSAAQVGFGLYGGLLVEDPNEPVRVADELTMVLSDISFDDKGTLESPNSGGAAGMVFGREGEYLLVNGRHHPVLRARAGAPQRWHIVNAAKSRFFFLEMEGQPFHVIGGDGGLQERTETTDGLLVTPGERVDVIVYPTGAPGSSIVVRAALYNRGYGSVEYRIPEDVFTVTFSQERPLPVGKPPVVSRSIPEPVVTGATPVMLDLTLPGSTGGKPEFLVNGVGFRLATPYLAQLGERQVWTVKNSTDWDHPFHLHGFFFLQLDEKGAPVHPMVWKDTINVPMKQTARFLVHFDERPGEWMFHCHILDHADGGLMGTVRVGPTKPTEHVHRTP